MRLTVLIPLLLAACTASPPADEDLAALEEAFEQSMRGAVLDGHFTFVTTDSSASEEASSSGPVQLRPERYEIEKVVRRSGDLWTFHARIQFGERDITLPVPVRLAWAGDTPVVGVTDLGLPGMGSYTARVVFYRDSYAGTWSGGEHGGHLFGRIEHPD